MKQAKLLHCPHDCGEIHLLPPGSFALVRGEAKKRRPSQSVKAKDEKWALEVKMRDGYRCRRCGKTDDLQAAHLFSRAKRGTRWDVRAGFCLCGGCHLFWAHLSPLEFLDWAKQELGEQTFEELRQLSETTQKRVKRPA